MTRILVVDNYDSFVYTLVGYLAELGADVEVRRNDALTPEATDGVDGILLSPGPGRPEDAGGCVELVRSAGSTTPVLGVCLGHQAIAVAYGGRVEPAPELLHGKTSEVHHDGSGILTGLADPFVATRYHSLAVTDDGLPPELRVTARTASGTVMALAHRDLPVHGVQFHPESVLTDGGYQLLATWLAGCGDDQAQERVVALTDRLDRQREARPGPG